MDTPKIFRLHPNGSPGVALTRLELDPDDFQSDLPEQFWHVYFEDAEAGLTVGVWTTTDMQEAFGPYPGNEFMVILEGRVALLDGEGGETVVNAGETFAVRNGAPVSWRQEGFCRKFFLIYDPPNAAVPLEASAEDGIRVLRQGDLEQKLLQTSAGPASAVSGAREAVGVTNAAGGMTVGLREWLACETPLATAARHEMVHVLSGMVQIADQDGSTQKFVAGDVYFSPVGAVSQRCVEEPTREYFCRIDPGQVPSNPEKAN